MGITGPAGWYFVKLGALLPQGQPTRSTSGSVTLAPVSFYWQNSGDPGDIPMNYFHFDPLISVSSADRPMSAWPRRCRRRPTSTVSQVNVCPTSGTQQCDGQAHPYANGLDQYALRIQLSDDNGVLPLSDPNYGRVYYTDQAGELVTGLIPLDGSTYIRVSP